MGLGKKPCTHILFRNSLPGLVVHAGNPSPWEVEVGRSQVRGCLGDPVSKLNKQTNSKHWRDALKRSPRHYPKAQRTVLKGEGAVQTGWEREQEITCSGFKRLVSHQLPMAVQTTWLFTGEGCLGHLDKTFQGSLVVTQKKCDVFTGFPQFISIPKWAPTP